MRPPPLPTRRPSVRAPTAIGISGARFALSSVRFASPATLTHLIFSIFQCHFSVRRPGRRLAVWRERDKNVAGAPPRCCTSARAPAWHTPIRVHKGAARHVPAQATRRPARPHRARPHAGLVAINEAGHTRSGRSRNRDLLRQATDTSCSNEIKVIRFNLPPARLALVSRSPEHIKSVHVRLCFAA